MRRRLLSWVLALVSLMSIAAAQQPAKPAMTPSAKLAVAKTAYLKRAGAGDIAWNVITSGLEGWGRYTLVETADKADIIIEVSQPTEGGFSVSSSTTSTTPTGEKQDTKSSSTRVTSGPIKLVVYDTKSKMGLWSATEQPKFAMKQKAREDNAVAAAQLLVTKFRQRVEPEPAR
jgi:hypothetical protein